MKTEVLPHPGDHLNEKQQQILTILCIGIVVSLIYWPLLNSILAILTFAYWLFFLKKKFVLRSVRGSLVIIFTITYLLIAIGYFNSSNTEEALFRMQQKIPLLIFPVIFGTIKFDYAQFLRRILWSLSIATVSGCAVCLLYGLYAYLDTGNIKLLFGYELIILKDMQPHVLALCCFLSITFHLQRILNSRVGILANKNIVDWCILIFLSLFIILLSNRMILFCWSITMLYFLYRFIPSLPGRVALTLSFIALLVLAVIFNPSLNSQWKDLIDFSEENSIQLDQDKSLGRGWGGKTVRLSIWKCSFDVIKEHWVLGVGTGDAQDELQKAYERRKFYFASMYNRYNAHNQYLQNLLMNGILALVAFLASLIYPLFLSLKKEDSLRIYTIFLLAVILIFCTESYLEINKGIVFYSFFNSIFAFCLIKDKRNPINSLS
jgi:O-antigen ligase